MTETVYRGRPLAIITMYRPIKAEGPTRVHTQAINKIRAKGLQNEPINVTKFLYEELEQLVGRFRENGGSIVVGGDFNEEDRPTSHMTEAMGRMGLVNAIRRTDLTTSETRKQGKKTIDHIWVSPDLMPEIVGSGYGRYYEGLVSDHRGCFI